MVALMYGEKINRSDHQFCFKDTLEMPLTLHYNNDTKEATVSLPLPLSEPQPFN